MKKYMIGSLITFIIMIGLIYFYNNYYLNYETTECFESSEVYSTTDVINLDNLTLLSKYNFDYDSDNIDEEIMLFTSAQKDENGIIMWSDGQNFTLIIEDDSKSYVLYDEYIQLGRLKLFAYTSNNGIFHITTLQPGSASILFTDYTYSSEGDYFEKKIIFNPENVNLMYESFYEY